MKIVSIDDFRRLAKRRIPRFLFEYIDGGAFAEVTLRRNIEDLEKVTLSQRVLRDVADIDLSTSLFGQRVAMPVALAPVGLAGLFARRGERQAAAAAEQANVPFCLSTVSACALEEVVQAVTQPMWFQLYMMRDRGFLRHMLARAQNAGCSALVFTVDMPLPGIRYRDRRSGLSGASNLRGRMTRLGQALGRPLWSWEVGIRGRPHALGNVAPGLGTRSGMQDFIGWMSNNFDPSVTWADLDFVRQNWSGPFIIKGILDVDDARAAAALGADGIVVSNHGGRQLDGVSSTASALPSIADAVGDRATVLVDGGIRSGLDVVRMLALGAHSVLLGRAWAFALAAAGEAGVARLLTLINEEMRVAMALTGANNIAALGNDRLAEAPPKYLPNIV